MKIEDIIEEWRKDCQIDDLNLDLESKRIADLHSKYAGMLSAARRNVNALLLQRRELGRTLRGYYLGTLTQGEYQAMNRAPCQQRILKNEIGPHIDSDELMIKLDAKLALNEEKVAVLADIVKHIHNRNFIIKGMIDWKRLMLGG